MKKWMVLVLSMFALWIMPRLSHPAKDIGKLEPIETVRVICKEKGYEIETDSGDKGLGATLALAIEDLKKNASSELFLETADKLLVDGNPDWEELMMHFRPSTCVCICYENVDLIEAGNYLEIHRPEMTLNRLRAGDEAWEILILEKGRGMLVRE